MQPIKSTFVMVPLLLFFIAVNADDFQTIKGRVVAEVMKSEVDDKDVDAILTRMKSDGSFNDINYADLTRTAGFPHRRHTGDLVDLAKA